MNRLILDLGTNGVLLLYIFCEVEGPDHATVNTDFFNRIRFCAPLERDYFSADQLSVFSYIVLFATGQTSGEWVKDKLRYSSGRRLMEALRSHFTGEGKVTHNIDEADILSENFHYKSERVMISEAFLTHSKKMLIFIIRKVIQ